MVPFTIETCWESGIQLYVVTKLDPGTTTNALQPGARVSHWNSIPNRPLHSPHRQPVRRRQRGRSPGTQLGLPHASAVKPVRAAARGVGLDLRFTLGGVEAEERFEWVGFTPAATSIVNADGIPDIQTQPWLRKRIGCLFI